MLKQEEQGAKKEQQEQQQQQQEQQQQQQSDEVGRFGAGDGLLAVGRVGGVRAVLRNEVLRPWVVRVAGGVRDGAVGRA